MTPYRTKIILSGNGQIKIQAGTRLAEAREIAVPIFRRRAKEEPSPGSDFAINNLASE
jgi:hypothetical protein